ncbi:lipoprotein [Colwellia sp. 20A7]|jgi:predicted small lipoprotein YifL|uniref:lipoprotein n=1 Tax=Colwellia sp. 20A7 TaxID=2689569 RepID=UPI0013568BB9|nr:lipoprotein [Colwellia sp. 20A7]
MHLIKHFSFFFLCFLISITLSACGSKGALYQVEETDVEIKSVVEEPTQVTEKLKKQP